MATQNPDDLRALAATITSEVDAFIKSLEASSSPLPSLSPQKLEPSVILQDPRGNIARATIVAAATRLLALVEEPIQQSFNSSNEYLNNITLKVAVDLGLQRLVPFAPASITAAQLAEKTGADEDVISRIMRGNTVKYIFQEVGVKTYSQTPLSAMLNAPGMDSFIGITLDDNLRGASRLPDALKNRKYQGMSSDAFKLAFDTKLEPWEYTGEVEPWRGQRFGKAMSAITESTKHPITQAYPWAEVKGTIVDVGGGYGAVMAIVKQLNPQAHIIVQDLPHVVNSVDPALAKVLNFQVHDFMTPQPVKGASVYFMSHILHDWPDDMCIVILKSIVPAMDPAKSRLLIRDHVLPDMNASPYMVGMDLMMAGTLGGKERTESELKALLKAADGRLELVKVWRLGDLIQISEVKLNTRA